MTPSSTISLGGKLLLFAGFSVSLFLFLPLVVYVTNLNDVEIAKEILTKWGVAVALVVTVVLFSFSFFPRVENGFLQTIQILVLTIFIITLFPNFTGEIAGFEGTNRDLLDYFAFGKFGLLLAAGLVFALRRPHQLRVLANVISVLITVASLILAIFFTSATDITRASGIANKLSFVELGSKSNIIVLLLDSFTGYRFLEILNEKPELKQKFEGFTIYPKAIAPAINTAAGTSLILTGNMELAISETDWVKKNSESLNNSFMADAQEAGYKTSYISQLKVQTKSIPATAERALVPKQVSTWQSDMESYFLFLTVSATRILPGVIAAYLETKASGLFAKNRGIVETDIETLKKLSDPADIGPLKSKLAFEYLVNNLHVGQSEKSAMFVLSKISHGNWNFTEEGRFKLKAGSRSTSVYVVNAVNGFIEKLKAIQSYDNSMIIIASDHGGLPVEDPNMGGNFTTRTRLEVKFNPLVMIKPTGAKGNLKISDMTVWLGDISPTIKNELGLNLEMNLANPTRSLLSDDDPNRIISVPLFFKPKTQKYHSALKGWGRVDASGKYEDYGAIVMKARSKMNNQ